MSGRTDGGKVRAAVALPALEVLVCKTGRKKHRFTAVMFIFLYVKFSGGINDSFQLDSSLRVFSMCEREWRQVAEPSTPENLKRNIMLMTQRSFSS